MSSSHWSWTKVVPKEFAAEFTAKGNLTSEDEHRLDDGGAPSSQTKFDVDKWLFGSSREARAQHVLTELLLQSSTPSLDFLTSTPYGENQVTLLSVKQVAALANDLESLLSWCLAHPDLVHAQMDDYCSEEELLEAMSASELSNSPDDGTEGEGPWYFFSYLKSLLAIYRHAVHADCPIVYKVSFE
jgi:hypothetical protein